MKNIFPMLTDSFNLNVKTIALEQIFIKYNHSIKKTRLSSSQVCDPDLWTGLDHANNKVL